MLCTDNAEADAAWKELIHGTERAVKRAKYVQEWRNPIRSPTIDTTEMTVSGVGTSNIAQNIHKLIRGKIVPSISQPAPLTHVICPSKFREENYKLIWNGSCLFCRNNKQTIPTTAYKSWLLLELYTQKETLSDNFFNLANNEELERKEFNQRLSDQVLFWFMELLPPLLTLPYEVAMETSKKSKAVTAMKSHMKSDREHNLASKIETRLEEDNKHIRIPKIDAERILREEGAKIANKVYQKDRNKLMQKNSSWSATTTGRKHKNGGDNGKSTNKPSKSKKGPTKRPKAIQKESELKPKKENKSVPKVYQRKKKTNWPNKHDYRKGGKKHLQKERQHN